MKNDAFVAFTSLLVILFTSSGCKDPKFGQKFKDFVYNEAPSISRDYADAVLDHRWEKTYQDYLLVSLSEIEFIAALVEGLDDYTETDFEKMSEVELLNIFVSLRNQENITTQLLQRVDSLNHARNQISTACESEKFFYNLGINSLILKDAFSMAGINAQSPVNYSVNSDMTFYENAIQVSVDFFINIFTKSEIEKQKKLFGEGLNALDKNIIKNEELFELSSRYCSKYKALYLESILEVNKRFLDIEKIVRSQYSFVQSQKRSVGPFLAESRIDRILIETGLDHVLHYSHYLKSFSEVSKVLTDASSMIFEAQRTMSSSPKGLKKYLAFENYQLQLENLEIELGVLKESQFWRDEVTMHRRIEILSTLLTREKSRIKELMR